MFKTKIQVLSWRYPKIEIYIDVDFCITYSDDLRSRILVLLGYWNVQSNLNLECLCLLEVKDCVLSANNILCISNL